MKIKTTAAVIAAGLILTGCSAKSDSSSDSFIPVLPTWGTADYQTDAFTTYDICNFSVRISNDFYDAEKSRHTSSGETAAMTFKSDLVDYISIKGYTFTNEAVSYKGETDYEDKMREEGVSELTYDLMDLDGFQGYAINYIKEKEDGLKGYSEYTAVCEGQELEIFAYYPAENAGKVVPMINDIMHSAVYISDYKLPSDTQQHENAVYSLSFGPEWVLNEKYKGESMLEKNDLEFSDLYLIANASDNAEASFMLLLEGNSSPEKNAAQHADEAFDGVSASGTDRISDVSRSQTQLLGQTGEEVSYRMTMSETSSYSIKRIYLDHNGKLLHIELYSLENDQEDEMLDRAYELINNIELK